MSSAIELRPFAEAELAAAAHVHLNAFTDSALTALGAEAVRRYYEWQLLGPHEVVAYGAHCDGELAGFCFGGVFRGSMSGFLQNNQSYLAWRVLTHPWLAINPLFRDRLRSGLGVLRRKAKANSNTLLTTPAPTAKPKPFGILAIAVNPKFQGRGIGKVLMLESEAVARQRGFAEMQLSVNTQNLPAIRFYEGLGWEKVMRQAHWEGEMGKVLIAIERAAQV